MAASSSARAVANGVNGQADQRVIRCAIYTRKSTEEGLQQDFNSLDAQREAAEAFIVSQKREGWHLINEHFDDGGYSGANMDRPALRRVLAAVEAGTVDCVVVYKVDRLSRSLLDFARIVETFDRNGVSFVSVTQQFNTTTSLGRLTLNILLSFVQFEREIISERTRDKMSAARRKGKWIGGHPVLGYDIDPKGGRLIVNPQEAEQVRTLFRVYLTRGSLLPALEEARSLGLLTKRWTTSDGRTRGGHPMSKAALYVIHQAPGPMMAVQPTVEMAKRNSKQRIDPLIEESEVLRTLVSDPRSRDSGNTMLAKEFPGGVLVMTGANSAVGLRSMAARYLFLDEVDGYPGDVDGEGDPINLAMARTRTFARRKVFMVSTPKITGMSRIEKAYDESDRRQYWVPCPVCREYQILKFPQLRWPKGDPEKATYVCEHCSQEIQNHQKQWMLARGQWRANPGQNWDRKTAGFHLSGLYSPVGWFSWADAAEQFEQAQKDPSLLQVFVNTVLGETWTLMGEAPDWKRLYDRREDYKLGTVPRGGFFLTAGADVQRDRIEVEVVACGPRSGTPSGPPC